MRRSPRQDAVKSKAKPARDPAFDLVRTKPESGEPERPAGELEERIERLERRIEESVRGNDGLAIAADSGVDRSETEDALRRAVSRSKDKRKP
jgi:hypothetical protein